MNHTVSLDSHFEPPLGPPPLLSAQQLITLARQGWLSIDLPGDFIQELQSATLSSGQFFDQSIEQKKSLYPANQGTEYGYYHVEDEKEYITFRNQVHPEISTEQAITKVWRTAALLLHRVLCDIARGTGLSHSIWDNILDGCLELPHASEAMTPTLLRTFRYFPQSGFAGEHSDLGLLTLCVGSSRGLEVVDRTKGEGGWVDAGRSCILIGEYLSELSNRLIRPGLHRVVGTEEGRSSIVFALRPSFRHPLDLSLFGGHGVIDPRELWQKIKSSKVNINATKDIRDGQREKQRAQRDRTRGQV